MVDFQPNLYDLAAKGLRDKFPELYVTGSLSDQPPQFPCAQIVESSNVPEYLDNGEHSEYARVQYRVRIYSNKAGTRVSEARSILAALDDIFEPLNLFRTSFTQDNGLYNNSAVQIDATYEAVIDRNGNISRPRTTY